MNLTLSGHDDRYAVEQLLLSLFPEGAEVDARSCLHRGETWLTATARVTWDGRTASASRRLKAAEETVRLRRRAPPKCFPRSPPGALWQGSGPPS